MKLKKMEKLVDKIISETEEQKQLQEKIEAIEDRVAELDRNLTDREEEKIEMLEARGEAVEELKSCWRS